MLSICRLGSGRLVTGSCSTALLLPTLLLDAPERARFLVSRLCGRGLGGTEVWVLAGRCSVGILLLPLSPEEESLGGVAVGWRAPVSDLYRGRVGGVVSVADALTPAETVCDRRRPIVDGAENDCFVGEGVIVASESDG